MDGNLVNDKLPDHIEEYLDSRGGNSEFIELFEATPQDVDLKTELNKKEIVVSNVVLLNAEFLRSKGIPDDLNIYDNFMARYMRLRVSLDRKSRAEFVNINKKDNFQDNLQTVGSFKNLEDLKK